MIGNQQAGCVEDSRVDSENQQINRSSTFSAVQRLAHLSFPDKVDKVDQG